MGVCNFVRYHHIARQFAILTFVCVFASALVYFPLSARHMVMGDRKACLCVSWIVKSDALSQLPFWCFALLV